MERILFSNLLILVNLSLYLKQPVAFVASLSAVLVHQYLTHFHQKKVEVNQDELNKLRNDVNALKTQLAFKKL